ncbi:uncharacterized protein SP1173 isoform X2 [Anabrus simplex]
MKAVGLTVSEAHIISIVVPLIAAIGPLVMCPLADRLGGGPGSRSMRALLAFTIFLAGVSYSLLMCVPQVQRLKSHQPQVNFTCGPNGAMVLQERCMEPACYEWPEKNIGLLILSDCHYVCHNESGYIALEKTPDEEIDTTPIAGVVDGVNDDYIPIEVDDAYRHFLDKEAGLEDTSETMRMNPIINDTNIIPLGNGTSPPHLCYSESPDKNTCRVYTKDSGDIAVNASLLRATNADASSEEWCRYPLAANFTCRIPSKLLGSDGHVSCQVICSLPHPYSSEASILAQSQCRRVIGDSTVTFWTYLVIRSVADMFFTTALGLLDAAIVIATRETNLGRGDVGRELLWATLGYAAFAPIMGYLHTAVILADAPFYWLSFTVCFILMTISAIILLFSHSMPLCRPEWWTRHARVMPFGGLKRNVGELIAFSFILVLLGAFWSALDNYLPWHVVTMHSTELYIGLSVLLGSLPAILFLWNAEKFVYYCGHSNLLITAFTFYIIRYIVECVEDPWVSFGCDILQVFTLSMTWVTVILYVRQLVPRHLTVTGQGLAVLLHFCLGRCMGAVYVAVVDAYVDPDHAHLIRLYQAGAVAAALVATIYFIVYHCCLKPCCQGTTGSRPRSPTGITQGPTTNGTYTPLRVYHNGSGTKGQMRY